MEILQYTDEHRMFRDALRRFLAKEITPHVEEWEEAGIVPREAWKKMGEQGFLAMDVPEEYGGLGADFLYSVIVTEEMVRTNHSGLAAPLHSDIIVPYIVAFASEEQKHKYLPGCISGDIITAIAMTEPNTGSDLAAIKTTAVESGDEIDPQRPEDLHQQRDQLRPPGPRRPRSGRRRTPTPRSTSSSSRREPPASKRESRSRRSAGTARTRRSSTSPTAGSRRRTAWATRGRAS